MAYPVTLSEAKDHLRIINETAEDVLIAGLVTAATAYIAEATNLSLDEVTDNEWALARVAILALVGEWYLNRDATGARTVEQPFGINRIINLIAERRYV